MSNNLPNDYEIVVAHYNEDLEWLKPYADHAIIYHKGNEDKPRFPVKKRIKLANTGREGETYLQHIINNYEKLADISIFLQGGMHDQLDNKVAYKNLDEYITEAEKYGFSTSRMAFLLKKTPQIKWEGKFLQALEDGTLKKSKYSFSDFYEYLFGKKQPIILPCFFAANFSVTKEKIQERPKNFYKKIHNHFIDHSNPEEGHYLERLWFKIFNPNLNFHYFVKIVKNPFISLFLSFKNKRKG